MEGGNGAGERRWQDHKQSLASHSNSAIESVFSSSGEKDLGEQYFEEGKQRPLLLKCKCGSNFFYVVAKTAAQSVS